MTARGVVSQRVNMMGSSQISDALLANFTVILTAGCWLFRFSLFIAQSNSHASACHKNGIMLKRNLIFLLTLLSIFTVNALYGNMAHALDGSIPELRTLPMVGAYSTRDVTDPSVIAAAQFAIDLYVSEQLQGIQSHETSFQVSQAAVQVVAGLNYKLSIRLYIRGICHGTLEDVVIYRDLSQAYTVSNRGTLNPCEEESVHSQPSSDDLIIVQPDDEFS
jgi:hypothetical protein